LYERQVQLGGGFITVSIARLGFLTLNSLFLNTINYNCVLLATQEKGSNAATRRSLSAGLEQETYDFEKPSDYITVYGINWYKIQIMNYK
jgi:hypothetical protein